MNVKTRNKTRRPAISVRTFWTVFLLKVTTMILSSINIAPRVYYLSISIDEIRIFSSTEEVSMKDGHMRLSFIMCNNDIFIAFVESVVGK
jgi:hypothetical protein